MARSHVFMAPKTISSLPELRCQGTGLFHLDFASGNASAENEPLQLSWWKSAPLYHSCREVFMLKVWLETLTWKSYLFIGLWLHQSCTMRLRDQSLRLLSSLFWTAVMNAAMSERSTLSIFTSCCNSKEMRSQLRWRLRITRCGFARTNQRAFCTDTETCLNSKSDELGFKYFDIFWLLLSQFSNTCLTSYIKFLHGPTDPSAQRFWHPPAASRRPTAREPPIEGAAQCGYCHVLWPHNPGGTRKQRPWKFGCKLLADRWKLHNIRSSHTLKKRS